MPEPEIDDLLLQSLETALGAERVYEAALRSAVQRELRSDWAAGLQCVHSHAGALRLLCKVLRIDPEQQSSSREIARFLMDAWVAAMAMAQRGGDPVAAQLVASEAVAAADAKHRSNCDLIAQCGHYARPRVAAALQAACDEFGVAAQLRHRNDGWCRELRAQKVRLPAMLPPPESVWAASAWHP